MEIQQGSITIPAHIDTNVVPPSLTCPLGDYMNSREAAAYLHINHRTLLEWARQGTLPGIPLGGAQRKTWLFSKSAIDDHLRGMMTANRPRSIQDTIYVN